MKIIELIQNGKGAEHPLSSFSSASGRNIVCHDYLAILRLGRPRVLRLGLQLELLSSVVEVDYVKISGRKIH